MSLPSGARADMSYQGVFECRTICFSDRKLEKHYILWAFLNIFYFEKAHIGSIDGESFFETIHIWSILDEKKGSCLDC